jgi:hypothetical protein
MAFMLVLRPGKIGKRPSGKRMAWLVAGLFLTGFAAHLSAETKPLPPLRLGGITQTDSLLSPKLSAFYSELGKRIGRDIILIDGPLPRLIQDFRDGRLDGFAYRTRFIDSLTRGHSARRIPISVASARLAMYSLDSAAPCLDDFRQLEQTAGKFSAMRGYIATFSMAKNHRIAERVIPVDSVKQALKMLEAQRTQYAMEIFDIMEARILEGAAPKGLEFKGTVSNFPVYMYLDAADTALFNRTESQLRALLADPTFPTLLPDSEPQHNPKGCKLAENLVGMP